MRSIWSLPVLAAVLVMVVLASPAGAAKRVPGFDARTVPKAEEKKTPDALVERIQRGLTEAGFYLGPINGVMNRETEAAVRAYRKHSGFPDSGEVDERLAQQLETGHKVQLLLQKLQNVRQSQMDEARRALMGSEPTRRLLEKPAADIADPTRDPTPCFKSPDPTCLLAEAAESAKAVTRPDMRDWARGEVLAAQAKAGLIPEAMDTARRIQDPRLIMVALRDIAEGQAKAGQGQEALEAAEIIPDSMKRAEALIAIAELQAGGGDASAARNAVERVLAMLTYLSDPLERIRLRTRAAVVFSTLGDSKAAEENLKTADAHARRQMETENGTAALGPVASALAEVGRPEDALEMLTEITENSDRTPIRILAAGQYAKTGDFDKALVIAQNIEEPRHQAVALCRIATAQADAGLGDVALAAIAKAERLTKEISLPFARDYASSHVSLALARLGAGSTPGGGTDAFIRAERSAEVINDDRLRSQTLWTISGYRRRAGDLEGAKETKAKARDSSFDIVSALTKAWMFGDISSESAEAGEAEAAQAAFRLGLDEAAAIDNAWARARAMAKLSRVLVDLRAMGVVIPPKAK